MAGAPSTSARNDGGSRTITITDTVARAEDPTTGPEGRTVGTLRLRAGTRHQQRVAWDEDVVDNEGCGRKSSKICCIYHKPRRFDESSSEESSSESESEDELHRFRGRHPRHHDRIHHHHHPHDREGDTPAPAQMRPDHAAQAPAEVHQVEEEPERNAYEIMPSAKKGKRKAAS
ncbi:putative protein phosphatase inhibitor [Lyophyllum shimeji]|uniref:Type 1 phosphatases regulator n=1 Tax=Lyophyllum shimeji TaxID=47721 RepID=A0A9P3PRK5_LYOSH|nr:putative protein phosphatase inhibitor [Lyophyllum shimeji]